MARNVSKGQWVKIFSRDWIQRWNFFLPSQKLCHDTLQQISEDCMANWFTSSQLNDLKKKTVGKDSLHSPRLVDPRKGPLHVWTRKRPDPPFLDSVNSFAEANTMNPSLWLKRYKHHYSDTLQQISKGCMANWFITQAS